LVIKNRDFAEEELKIMILKYKNPNSFKKRIKISLDISTKGV